MRRLLFVYATLLLASPVCSCFVSSAVSMRSTAHYSSKNEYIPPPGKRVHGGGDMAYTRETIDRQRQYYHKIREVGGIECVNDVYARNPQSTQFWFIGKVARCTGTVSLKQAIARQWNLLEEHAVRLRPVELGRCFGSSLELWTAPGDSELACAQNLLSLSRMERLAPECEAISFLEVGFDCQVVTNEGLGFYVERRSDGTVFQEAEGGIKGDS